MRHLNGVYTQRYNRIHHCDGQLIRGRYKAILIEADSYLLELLRYTHRNPLDEISKILGSRKLPPVLGTKNFIDKIEDLFFSDKSHEEVPEPKSLAPDPDRILEAVAKLYK